MDNRLPMLLDILEWLREEKRSTDCAHNPYACDGLAGHFYDGKSEAYQTVIEEIESRIKDLQSP